MNECKHLLQMRNSDGTISCLVCEEDVATGPITPFPGPVANIADDPLLDYLATGRREEPMSDDFPTPEEFFAVQGLREIALDINRRIDLALNPPPAPDEPETLDINPLVYVPTEPTTYATPTPENLAFNLIAIGEHLMVVAETLAREIEIRAGIQPAPPVEILVEPPVEATTLPVFPPEINPLQ